MLWAIILEFDCHKFAALSSNGFILIEKKKNHILFFWSYMNALKNKILALVCPYIFPLLILGEIEVSRSPRSNLCLVP